MKAVCWALCSTVLIVSNASFAQDAASANSLPTGSNEFVVLLLVIMSCLYVIQALLALARASAQKITTSRYEQQQPAATPPRTLLAETFSWGEPFTRTWLATIAILAIPVLLTWLPSLPHSHIDTPEERANDIAAYFLCVSIITVLITVELTLLFGLRGQGTQWRAMLVTALGLDVVSLYLFTGYIQHPKLWHTTSTSWTWIYMVMTGCLALASSFVIVLFSKSANDFQP
jgi:hypothetical protein